MEHGTMGPFVIAALRAGSQANWLFNMFYRLSAFPYPLLFGG
jgi:hypothetical protein